MEHEIEPGQIEPDQLPPAPMGPVSEPERIDALDTLRGFAIFGIFMVNIVFFTKPFFQAVDPARLIDADAATRISWTIVKLFFEMKFVSLFSMMFGIGLVIQMTRAESRGVPFVPLYLRRLVILLGIGLCHALLLWYGDILVIYAFVGAILLACRRLAARTMLITATVLLILGLCCTATCTSLQFIGEAFQETPADTAAAAEPGDDATPDAGAVADPGEGGERKTVLELIIESQGNPTLDAWAQAEMQGYGEGPMLDTLIIRAATWGQMMLWTVLTGFGLRIVATFFIGAGLMKLGFFSRERSGWHRRLMVLGLGIGLPLEGLVVLCYWGTGFEYTLFQLLAETMHYPGSIALALGYLATVTWIVTTGKLSFVTRGFAAVGRTALTNYLAQTVIATTIFYWWGLGLFGQVERPAQLGLVVGIFVVQIMVSVLWLKVFRIGPMEWLWRSLTYLRPQPFLRR